MSRGGRGRAAGAIRTIQTGLQCSEQRVTFLEVLMRLLLLYSYIAALLVDIGGAIRYMICNVNSTIMFTSLIIKLESCWIVGTT